MEKRESFGESITPREQVILRRLGEDRTNADIASIEILALSSVKWYVQQICGKLGVKNRREAVTRARELGLLEAVRPVIEAQPPTSASNPPQKLPSLLILEKERHNLPRRRTPYIGRADSIALLKTWLDDNSLITLTGSGGVGKTRLAIQVAEEELQRFPDGAWLVELAVVTDPGMVVKSIATVLSLQEEITRSIQETLLNYLRKKSLLIILDNCEHLLDTCARLADLFLTTCPHLRLLATSREPLNVSGEKVYRVPSMQFPDPENLPDLETFQTFEAVHLFVERVMARQAGFIVNAQNAPAIAEICRRLDGIPLAIGLAAARLNVLSIDQLAGRLDQAFRILTGGARTALPRQQTLRAAIDWSYLLLNEHEKVLLRRLSIFSGTFDLEAVEAVCGLGVIKPVVIGNVDPGDILDLLSSLVNKSLVIAENRPGVGMRYRLLEIMRQYSREKLIDAGESETLRDYHLDYYVLLAEHAAPHMHTAGRLDWFQRLEAEMENFREALDWSFQDYSIALKGLRIAAALGAWFWFKGTYREDIDLLQKGLALVKGQAISPLLEVKVITILIHKYMALRDTKNRMAWSEKCIQLCRAIGSQANAELSLALSNYGSSVAKISKDLSHAREWKDESVRIARGLGPEGTFYLALTLFNRVKYLDDPQQGYQDTLESYQLFHQCGDRWMASLPLSRLGYYAEMAQDFPKAQKRYTEALSLGELIDDPINITSTVISLGRLNRKMTNFKLAISFHMEYIQIWNRFGAWEHLPDGIASVAIDYFCQAQEKSGLIGNKGFDQDTLIHITKLIAVAEKLRTFEYENLFAQDLGLLDQAIEKARHELGEQTFQKVWGQGQAMTQDDAVALAVEVASASNE